MLWLIPILLLPILVAQEPPRQEAPHDMVLVPAGEFIMGTDDGNADEGPAHRVDVSAFYIDRHEVTNASFAEFVRQGGSFDRIEGPWFRYYAEGCIDLIGHYERRYGSSLRNFEAKRTKDGEGQSWKLMDHSRWRSAVAALREMLRNGADFPSDAGISELVSLSDYRRLVRMQARLPVRGVTWRDASAFAHWAGKRLPTEAEWERAARGADRRRYPWGANWARRRCQSGLGANMGPVPVGSFPNGASPYNCLDMAGNVWEWVADWYGERYYTSSEGAVDPKGPKGLPGGRLPSPSAEVNLLRTTQQGRESNTRKVIRGGGWGGSLGQARFNTRCTRRLWSNPSYWHPDVGFRCAKGAE